MMLGKRSKPAAFLFVGLGCCGLIAGVYMLAVGVNPYARAALAEGAPDDGHGHESHGDTEDRHDEQPAGGPEAEDESHAGHDAAGENTDAIVLSDEVLREFDIAVESAKGGEIDERLTLPGEILLNGDRIAHIVPRVSGIVREVAASAGEVVEADQLLAVIESRELAEAKAAYLAARERVGLAQANFTREEKLWKAEISAERDYLDARQALAESRIELKLVEQQLFALGFSAEDLDRLTRDPATPYTRYEIRAPIAGTVIERHMTLGESVDSDTSVLTIADLSTVWVNITVYQKDLALVRAGQTVRITNKYGLPEAEGVISFVNVALEESTRTTYARIVLDNPGRDYRPGLFVSGELRTGSHPASVVIPRSSVIRVGSEDTVFVRTERGFTPRAVELGRAGDDRVEVVSGLAVGEAYAAANILPLKAQLDRAALEHAGHAH